MHSSSRYWPQAVFAVLVLAAIVWEVNALFVPGARVRVGGRDGVEIADFAKGHTIGQIFRMPGDGLASVVVQFSADRPAWLRLRCRLLTRKDYARDQWNAVYQWTETLELTPGRRWHRFPFAPVERSRFEVYQFDVQQMEVRALGGNADGGRPVVSVIASTADALQEGAMVVGGTPWPDRDLLFRAYGADSAFEMFRLRNNPGLPGPLRPRAVQIALLTAFSGLVAMFAFHMTLALPEPSEKAGAGK